MYYLQQQWDGDSLKFSVIKNERTVDTKSTYLAAKRLVDELNKTTNKKL